MSVSGRHSQSSRAGCAGPAVGPVALIVETQNAQSGVLCFCLLARGSLRQMLGHQFGHLKHVDHLLAAEDRLKVGVGVDVALVLRILQVL